MKLSEHFTYRELTRSDYALRNGIANVPNDSAIRNLTMLCAYVLEPLRERIGLPIHITSGYRCYELNRAIGGSPNSQHILGQAVDLEVDGFTPEMILQILLDSYISVDQAIDEYGADGWTHLSWAPNPRNQFLRARKVNGSTIYSQYP